MYAIISGGELISLCDTPRYIKIKESTGVYIAVEPEEAIGVAVAGNVYNINGGNAIPDAPQAIIKTDDAGEYVFRNRARIVKNEEDTATAFVEVENALCDLDIAADEKLTAMENALCELDTLIAGEVKTDE